MTLSPARIHMWDPPDWRRGDVYTLEEMLTVSVSSFQELIRALQELKCEFGWELVPRDGPIDQALAKRTENALQRCFECSETLRLQSSKRALARYLPAVKQWGLFEAIDAIKDVDRRIQDDLETELFLHVDSRFKSYYLDPIWIGQECLNAFPSMEGDAREAATCYVLERYTACVFHLMRILEYGLAALAISLGVPITNPNWHQVLLACENKIKDVAKVDQQFYNGAALEFRHFQKALRNHTAHAHSSYGHDEAETAMDHVKSFMRHIAARLSEVPPQ